MDFRKTLLLVFAVGLVSTALGQDTGLNLYDSDIDLNQNNITSPSQITSFFDQDKCGDSEAIKTVYPNGSYACNQLSTTTEAENLSETLAAGNIANQTLNMTGELLGFSGGVEIGTGSTDAYDANDVAIGKGAVAKDTSSPGDSFDEQVAIGEQASATDYSTTAVGPGSSASSSQATAIGAFSSASDFDSVAIGYSSSTIGSSAVSIGINAEASGFDSLALGGSSKADNEAVAIGEGASALGTATVAFGKGSSADQPGAMALGPSSSADGQEALALGSSSSARQSASVALGKDSSASTESSIVIGNSAGDSSTEGQRAIVLGATDSGTPTATGDDAIGIGTDVTASANGAVAIGDNANAPNNYEATFGNLNGNELDVNVTGNLTVHQDATVQDLTVEGSCTGCGGGGGGSSGLPDVLSNNNTAGSNNLDMFGQNITDSTKGNVTVDDSLKVWGKVYYAAADLAEIYPADQDLEEGTVVKVSDRGDGNVERTTERFDASVGVVSTDPAQVMGSTSEGVPVALEGRVPVSFDDSNGEVEPGDRLIASEGGEAIKCEVKDIEKYGDVSFSDLERMERNSKCRSNSIGKALSEPEDGKVMVVLG